MTSRVRSAELGGAESQAKMYHTLASNTSDVEHGGPADHLHNAFRVQVLLSLIKRAASHGNLDVVHLQPRNSSRGVISEHLDREAVQGRVRARIDEESAGSEAHLIYGNAQAENDLLESSVTALSHVVFSAQLC